MLNLFVEIREQISTFRIRETEAELEVLYHTLAKTKGDSIC